MTHDEIALALNNGEQLFNKRMYMKITLKDNIQITKDSPLFESVFRNPEEWVIAVMSDGMS